MGISPSIFSEFSIRTFESQKTIQGSIVVSWTGAPGPYLVQMKTNLTVANWQDVMTITSRSISLPIDSESGFFRVVLEDQSIEP